MLVAAWFARESSAPRAYTLFHNEPGARGARVLIKIPILDHYGTHRHLRMTACARENEHDTKIKVRGDVTAPEGFPFNRQMRHQRRHGVCVVRVWNTGACVRACA